jgi:hypothetical protein
MFTGISIAPTSLRIKNERRFNLGVDAMVAPDAGNSLIEALLVRR